MADEALIVLKGVNKWFGPVHVLRDVDLSVDRGEVVVVIGPSGSGKSTLCRAINRLEPVDSGTITFAGVHTDPALKGSLPGRAPLTQNPVRYQAGFAAVLVGLGIGALRTAIPFVRENSRPWGTSGVDRAIDDPLLRRLAGELAADLVSDPTVAAGNECDSRSAFHPSNLSHRHYHS